MLFILTGDGRTGKTRWLEGLLDVHEPNAKGLLVIDELGWPKLVMGGGFTSATNLLDLGPRQRCGHALVVVRKGLLPRTEGLFPLWGNRAVIAPDGRSLDRVLKAVCS